MSAFCVLMQCLIAGVFAVLKLGRTHEKRESKTG